MLLWRRRRWHPTPVFSPGEPQGRGSLVRCSPWGAKSPTGLSDFTFTLHLHALEKAVAPHSSVLAWRIPGAGEPGALPSMGSHRVGHDWSDLAAEGSRLLLEVTRWWEVELNSDPVTSEWLLRRLSSPLCRFLGLFENCYAEGSS